MALCHFGLGKRPVSKCDFMLMHLLECFLYITIPGTISFWIAFPSIRTQSHKWTVYVRGARNEDLGVVIKRVVFQLHPSFKNPVRVIESPPFELSECGWGEFEIAISLFFHNDACDKQLDLWVFDLVYMFYHLLLLAIQLWWLCKYFQVSPFEVVLWRWNWSPVNQETRDCGILWWDCFSGSFWELFYSCAE